MNLTEAFIGRQKELRGASLRGFMQTGNTDQLLLLFEKDDKLIGLNITERKNGDDIPLGIDIDLCEMLGDNGIY